MTKYRGVKIVPVKIVKFEVRTVDNRKLQTFGTSAKAKAWVDGYLKAVKDLTPVEPPKPKRRRRVNGEQQQPATTTA
jgi:hypothetical protein